MTPHLCMVAPTAYPVLAGRSDLRAIGGAEVQQVMVARELVQAGMRVTFVCLDYGQPAEQTLQGIRVLRAFAPDAGLRGLRFFHPRWTGLRAALDAAGADVYYQRSAGMEAGLVAHWCRQRGRPFVYASASDLDFQPGPPNVRRARDRWLFNAGLRAASVIIVQTERQQAMLAHRFGRSGKLIASSYVPPVPSAAALEARDEVLWVGGIRRVKRPDRFLALARAMPQHRFRMIGGPPGDSAELLAYYFEIEAEANRLPNLSFMGFLPFAEAEAWFDRAALLVNTSEHEGFPNTFLQAWSRGVPCAALFDTGSRLDGRVPYELAADEPALAQAVDKVMRDARHRAVLSALGSRCFETHHAPAVTVASYRALMQQLLEPRADDRA